jgi:hypothetical protein
MSNSVPIPPSNMPHSNEEIICGWMEPKPWEEPGQTTPKALLGSSWWDWAISYGSFPKPLTLDRLHEVEGRLTDEQWGQYATALSDLTPEYTGIVQTMKLYIHATAAQKIKALAAVLREGGTT